MTSQETKTIAITLGEPAGIGPEITHKAIQNPAFKAVNFILIGDQSTINNTIPENVRFHHIPFSQPINYGECSVHYAQEILQTIDFGVKLCLDGIADALVTAPVNKDNIHAVQPEFLGHTDYIAQTITKMTGTFCQPVMMLACPDLRAVPLTTHIALKDVPSALSVQMIMDKIKIIDHSLQSRYKTPKPRIAVAGLNPHAGDQGIMGTEEKTLIIPALEQLRSEGLKIMGPLAADTLFHSEARKNYDIAVCMYHDQALIPVKTLGFDQGVNVTLGLPIIRTSPDHGTALDIAGTNKANPSAMIAAIHEALL